MMSALASGAIGIQLPSLGGSTDKVSVKSPFSSVSISSSKKVRGRGHAGVCLQADVARGAAVARDVVRLVTADRAAGVRTVGAVHPPLDRVVGVRRLDVEGAPAADDLLDRDVQQHEEMPEAGCGVDGILRHAVRENDRGGVLQGLEQCRPRGTGGEIRAGLFAGTNRVTDRERHPRRVEGRRAHGRPAS